MTKKLNPLDASWLQVESRDTPMHVAQLQIFSLPDDAPEGFVLDLVARAKASKELQEPWNLKLRGGRALPVWIEDDNVDMDYHFRHLSVPRPGGERELGVLVSLLHSTQLDLSRPLWECTMIEGLEGNRVALYTKIHHSLVDGVSGARMMSRVFSPDPNERNMVAPWRVPPPEKTRREKLPAAPAANPMQVVKDQFGAKVKSASSLISALRRLRRAKKTPGDALVGPFTGPKSVLNGRVNQARRFATQQYDLAELKALAAKADCSLNDIVLYLCATALRRFLGELDQLPKAPLTAGIPVNVRPADDQSTGNAISFIMATLATDIADPMARLAAIKASTARAKEHLQAMPKSALTQYTMMIMGPYTLQLLTGLGGRAKPVFNITISNVPGPDRPLYWNGAKLEATYPVSLIAHGGALNITCLSYAGTMNFGFTGCRDTLPHMQRIAVYTGEALEELRTLIAAFFL